MKLLIIVAAAAASAGCLGAEQTQACKEFVACVRELDARDGETTDAVRFEADGACWSGPTIAELCDRACVRGIEVLRADDPTLTCEVLP
jgi:hypothetical protein